MKTFSIQFFKLPILIVLVTTFLTSCSSIQDEKLVELTSEDIAKEFDLEEKQLTKFQVTAPEQKQQDKSNEAEVSEEQEAKKAEGPVIKPPPRAEIRNVPKKKARRAPKKKVTPAKEEKKVTVAKEAEPVKEKKAVKPLPEDYPEDFIKMDKESLKVWEKFEPVFYENEVMKYKVAFMGVTAGSMELTTQPEVSVGDKQAYRFTVHLKSADYYSYIYELDDRLESIIGKENFKPIKYSLLQRETSQRVDDFQFFDHDEKKTLFFYRRNKKGKVKKTQKNTYVPSYFNDSFSALYFVRGLPLKLNRHYQFPIVTRGKVWMLSFQVVSLNDQVRVEEGRYSAIKIKAQTHFPGVLKKRGDIIFWYSNDKIRKFLKFEAKVKLGTITGELVDYLPGKAMSDDKE